MSFRDCSKLTVGVALIGILQTVIAQKQPLSLDEAIVLSLKNNKQLKASAAKAAAAEAAMKSANRRQLPDLSVSGAHLRVSHPALELKLTPDGKSPALPSVNAATYGMANASLPIFSGGAIQRAKEASRYLAEAATLD